MEAVHARDRSPQEVIAMRYLCLIRIDPGVLDALPARELHALIDAHRDYDDTLRDAGHFIEAAPLEPAALTTSVRGRRGEPSIVDGPFAETKEQVAGFYLIDARDLNDAIRIAARLPSASLGSVEVRAVRPLAATGQAA